MSTRAHLLTVLKAEPFRPSVLHLSSGRDVRVDHPENVAFLGNGSNIAVSYPRTDDFEIAPLLFVASVEIGRPSQRRRSA